METFWKKPSWESKDKHLKAILEAPFQRPFPFLLPPHEGIYMIRGPRQIGKSSWLKTMLSEAIRQRHSAFYLSCENITDHTHLAELLRSLRGTEYIFLDEISFVKDWAHAVKHEADGGHLQFLILTGSHAVDLKNGMDQMPGRWGGGGAFELLPMDFDEFSRMRAQAGWSEGINQLSRVEELELFFTVGGFPAAVIESGPKGRYPARAAETYRQWLSGDLAKLGKQEIYLREMMGQIAKSLTSGISLQTLAQKTQMGSHHTAQDYIEVLERCFALTTLYCMDADEDTYRFRKEKKLYFRDPLIYWIALDWAGIKRPELAKSKVAELVAQEALFRRYRRYGYFSSKQGEIDFISSHDWAIEVKWVDAVTTLSDAYRKFRAAKKITWSQVNFLLEWP